MHKYYIAAISLLVLLSCNPNNHSVTLINTTILDTLKIGDSRPLDSLKYLKDSTDNSELTYSELKKELIENYPKVEQVDTTFYDNQNSKIRVLSKYYCLFDNSITIPGRYNWEASSKTFTTHSFRNDIIVIVNNDTTFKKTIDKAFFNDNLYSELKHYAILFSPTFNFDKETSEIEVDYSISIPLTDLGISCQMRIDKKGNCRIEE
jgi:hypothetical protein